MALSTVVLGGVGGFLAQSVAMTAQLRAWRDSHRRGFPWQFGSVSHWVIVFFWTITGAFVVWIQADEHELSRLLAVQIGATAPLFLERLTRSVPDIPLRADDKDESDPPAGSQPAS